MLNKDFSWVKTHKQLVQYLSKKEKNQKELIELLKSVGITPFNDQSKLGENNIELDEIDPFTFFCYIHKYGSEKRLKILQEIAKNLNLEIPQGEKGIPSAQAQKVWMFPFKYNRKNNEVSRLWKFFHKSMEGKITDEDFEGILNIEFVGKAKLTEALFYINPEKYFPVNGPTIPYLQKKYEIETKFNTYTEYLDILEKLKEKNDKPFYEISYDAWKWKQGQKKPDPKRPQNVTKRYWVYSPGRNASKWEEYYEKGIMGIGWNELGDLKQYKTKGEITKKLQEIYKTDSSKKNDAAANWDFFKTMKVGDIVIAKRGTKEYLGYGAVISDYLYNEESKDYRSYRKVDWKNKGIWEESRGPIVLKTLTDITKYPDYVKRLSNLLNINDSEEITPTNYFWLYSNPAIWELAGAPVGSRQRYTAMNERGNKRRIFKNFEDAKVGDEIIGYVSSPIKQITSICQVTRALEELNNEEIEFEIVRQIKNPVEWEEIINSPAFENSEVKKNSQGSFFKLEKDEHDFLMELIDYKNPPPPPPPPPPTKELKDLFIEEKEFDLIQDALEYKKNIILQGPPGVGKTFYAKRIAYYFMKTYAKHQIETVQFHQSFSYEDFIQGYRPTEDGKFLLKNGIFYNFCLKAQRDPENKYVFIIDEINRGNLSKIFGELMMLIENDKRGKENEVSLTYQQSSELKFHIPENLYLIGTMNTADRSLAMVDYALRRRFRFINLEPEFNDKFTEYLKGKGVKETVRERIVKGIKALNEEISEKDKAQLGKGFRIGHSFFTPTEKIKDSEKWYEDIIEHEIKPLLEEYYYNSEERYQEIIKDL